MRYNDLNSSLQAHVMTLRIMLGCLVIINLLLWYGWHSSRDSIRVHIPPDIRSGASFEHNKINPANIYAFAFYIFQQLNHWPENGEKDFAHKIFALSAYITPGFLEYLKNELDIRGKRGELIRRVRLVQEIPGRGYSESRVKILGNNAWIVSLDLQVLEYVQGMEVKNIKVRFPMRVVRFNVDPETNPWGLALDGFSDPGPRRLTEEELKQESADAATTQPEEQHS